MCRGNNVFGGDELALLILKLLGISGSSVSIKLAGLLEAVPKVRLEG
jgi:hypothetical protein